MYVSRILRYVNLMNDFEFFIMIWGYSDSGSRDKTAAISEARYGGSTLGGPMWDSTQEYRNTVRLNGSMLPEYFCLYWVCEHIRRHYEGLGVSVA